MINQRVKTILTKQFGKPVDAINDTDDLQSLGADSLDAIEIVMALEEEFKVAIEENEYKEGMTVNSIIELVESKLRP
jgi:acyl carrier protein